jgi:hypothetical protein
MQKEGSFNRAQAISDYTRLMKTGPKAENEEELRALVEKAYSHGLYFDYDQGKQAYILQEQDPFPHLDFEEEVKSIHWETVHTKLTMPGFEVTLAPDGRLLLSFTSEFTSIKRLLDRNQVVGLTRFLNNYAQVEPLPPPDEAMFEDFKPNPVDTSTEDTEG